MVAVLSPSPAFTYYSLTPEQIIALYVSRLSSLSPFHTRMRDTRDAYNGDIFIPFPNKISRSAVPNLVAQGLDKSAMRVSSVLYDVRFPPDRPGVALHEKRARQRRQAALGWLEHSSVPLKQRRRARWLLGYGCSPVLIRPSLRTPHPLWQVRDPLSTFPARTNDPDDMSPPDVIFSYQRSAGWLYENYPDALLALRKNKVYGSDGKSTWSRDTTYTILEYVDAYQTTCILLSSTPTPDRTSDSYLNWGPASSSDSYFGSEPFTTLHSIPNPTGLCPAVVPGRITLDKDQGAYEGIIGMYQTMATLFALEVEAVGQGVWPDTWLIARPNESARVVKVADGRTGEIGEIEGGDIRTMVENPGYMTDAAINKLERYMRVGASIPSEYGGEAATNVRTGRRGQDIMAAAVDFDIQEAQQIFARSAEEEIKRGIALQKAFYGDLPVSFYVSWPGATGNVDYTPNQLFTSDRVSVKYSYPGTDINNLTIILGQLQGLGLISQSSALEMLPLIEDVELEKDRIKAEQVERAFWAWVQGAAAQGPQGGFTAEDIGYLMEAIGTNKKEPWEAIVEVQRRAQERQSQTVNPAQPGSPEAQPGLSPPGAGAESGEAVQPPQQGPQNVASVLSTLYPATAAMGR